MWTVGMAIAAIFLAALIQDIYARKAADEAAKEASKLPPGPVKDAVTEYNRVYQEALKREGANDKPLPSSDKAADAQPAPTPPPPPQPIFIPRTEKLFTGQLQVRPGQMIYKEFHIDTDKMSDVRVFGRFSAMGGMGNDIQAVLSDGDNFENWKNGHPAPALYSTQKVTVGELNTPILQSGTYYFCFSNRFSAFTSKQVFAEINLTYKLQIQPAPMSPR